MCLTLQKSLMVGILRTLPRDSCLTAEARRGERDRVLKGELMRMKKIHGVARDTGQRLGSLLIKAP